MNMTPRTARTPALTDEPLIAPTVVDHWQALPLDAGGRSLIEASAGTGKTWTISVLYLRLLLERQLSPRAIVVTTFTDAAAQELRERLHARLLWAEREAERSLAGLPRDGDAPDATWLRARWRVTEAETTADADVAEAEITPGTGTDASDAHHSDVNAAAIRRDLTRLRLALAELDLAPITTLHGLCRRILADFPFESGSSFVLGDLIATDSLLAELSTDAWRVLQQGDDAALAGALGIDSRQKLGTRIRAFLTPSVALWAPTQAQLDAALTPALAAEIRALATRPGLANGKRYALRNAWLALVDWIEQREGTFDGKPLEHVIKCHLDEQIAAEHVAELRHSLLLARIADAARLIEYHNAARRTAAWQAWIARVREWRDARLAASGQLTFDELIERVHRALADDGGGLGERLHAAWPVALVDEFQDTDGQQYGILDRIYRDDGGAERGRLVMIGDPKQAIYRFRGGDIHAYQRASRESSSHLQLGTNFRSSRAMVAACNEFYALTGDGLGAAADTAIRYQRVEASGRRDDAPYCVDDVVCERPLVLHFNDAPAEDAEGRRRAALDACANHIVDLLAAGTHRIGAAPLRPGHIAVLLPSNGDVARLRERLVARGVPCVGAGKASVFTSDWASDLQIVLHAVANPRDEGALRAALATRLGGLRLDDLRALQEQPVTWQREVERFEHWHALWRARGVLAVVQAVIAAATPRLFARADHERALTDLRHLGELLQAHGERVSGAQELLAWLADQRAGDGDDAGEAADEMQLRLESEADRVRLMTLHASKGLEFDVVMLPLMWNHSRSRQDAIPVVHEPLCGQRVVGLGDAAQALYDAEGQDERFRVLYVALTRARHACHVYALPPERGAQSGSDQPRRDPVRAPLDAILERAATRLGAGATLQTASRHLGWSSGWPWPHARYAAAQTGAAATRRVCDEPSAAPLEQKYSFSALIRPQRHAAVEDAAASDEAATAVEARDPLATAIAPAAAVTDESPAHPALQALAPVKGTEFGNAVHAVFEHRAIGAPLREQLPLVRQQLLDAGVRLRELPLDELAARVAERIDATLRAPLLQDPGFTLGALPARALRAEMEFHFALGEASMQRLREACAAHGEPALVPAGGVQALRGLMTGKIDLVLEHGGRFHVLDYKGNWLGERLADYAPAALVAAMDAHHYRFQALLYTVAVDRYLRQRLPQYRRHEQLGAAIYLFIRATGLAPDAGAWSQRFDDALIEAVDAALAGASQVAA